MTKKKTVMLSNKEMAYILERIERDAIGKVLYNKLTIAMRTKRTVQNGRQDA
jgi:hypothetical protein